MPEEKKTSWITFPILLPENNITKLLSYEKAIKESAAKKL